MTIRENYCEKRRKGKLNNLGRESIGFDDYKIHLHAQFEEFPCSADEAEFISVASPQSIILLKSTFVLPARPSQHLKN